MSVPTYDRFIEPVLRHLAAHPDGVPARNVHEAAADALGVSGADRQELVPSGTQPIYKNRAGWAHDRLKRAGLSSSPRRGFWQLTGQGRAFADQHAAPLGPKEVEQLAIEFARSVERIVLVDGARLAELMIDHEVGVSARTVKVPKLDSDYFDEEST